MKTLTVFTPTYNRAHTLTRLYRSLCRQTSRDFEWLVIDDGSTDGTRALVEGFIGEGLLPIRYVRKENGGLYTGYNTAYVRIRTELNVCIDSDDWMPDDAVERIVRTWRERGSERYAGLVGLDCDARTGEPIGGRFPADMTECCFYALYTHRLHRGDSKQVMRTDLMRRVAPQVGFPGEKNFNPVYMLLQVCDDYPLIVLDECLCIVEYQEDGSSMSRAVFRQYMDSPRSFAKTRMLEMTLKHNTFLNKCRVCIHYVAESLLACEGGWLRRSPCRVLTLCMAPAGWLLSVYIRHRCRQSAK